MNLIYINEIGVDHKGNKQYEFIFSESGEVVNDEWFVIPASASTYSKVPEEEYIDLVGLLKNTDLELELVQDSDYFGLVDAVDNVVSLGWETFDEESDLERLYFRFGETLESVVGKLKSRGYNLLKENIKNE